MLGLPGEEKTVRKNIICLQFCFSIVLFSENLQYVLDLSHTLYLSYIMLPPGDDVDMLLMLGDQKYDLSVFSCVFHMCPLITGRQT